MTTAGDIFERPVFARARRLCLQLPEAIEKVSWGHPTFRAGRKTFCAFEMIAGRPSIAFRLPRDEVEALLRDHSSEKVQKRGAAAHSHGQFFLTPYGRGLWASVWVDGAVNWKLIAALVDASYRTVATRRLFGLMGTPDSQLPPTKKQR